MAEHRQDQIEEHEYKDFVIIPDDEPGVLARMGQALGDAGINIESVSAFTGKGKGIVHLLVRDPAAAQDALSRAGFDVRAARDVIVLRVDDVPGTLGGAAEKLADAGVNIEQAYVATNNRIVFAVDDVERGKKALLE
jgi:hypothetical protein